MSEISVRLHKPLVSIVTTDPDDAVVAAAVPASSVSAPEHQPSESDSDREESELSKQQVEADRAAQREREMFDELNRLRSQIADLSGQLDQKDQLLREYAEREQFEVKIDEQEHPSGDTGVQSATDGIDDDFRPDLANASELEEEKGDLKVVLTAISEAANTLRLDRKRLLEEVKTSTAHLAVAIASRLIHAKISADDFPMESLIQDVVKRLDTAKLVVLRLNPEDLALLSRRAVDLQSVIGNSPEIEVVPDETLQRGDCQASANDVTISSRLESQLSELRDQLLGAD